MLLCADGSFTLRRPQEDSYHSCKGAVTESKWIYIERGLQFFCQAAPSHREIRILEIGMGTALNVLLSALYASQMKCPIFYTALEPYPLSEDVFLFLMKKSPQYLKVLYEQIARAPFGQHIKINSYFSIYKKKDKLLDFRSKMGYDMIYFDAFSKQYQKDMWTSEVCFKLYQLGK